MAILKQDPLWWVKATGIDCVHPKMCITKFVAKKCSAQSAQHILFSIKYLTQKNAAQINSKYYNFKQKS